jgi:hypothetical protein
MFTLDEWNSNANKYYTNLNIYPKLNNIACPKCGKEMYDTDNNILTSNPPKKNIHCICGYKGYRIC